MSKAEVIDILGELPRSFETEILEFKEAKNGFKVKELGQYFSALSNEANLKGRHNAYLIFGVEDSGEICGTGFRQEPEMPSKGLQRLKKEIADQTNNGITFKEIEELEYKGKRVVAFEIPPAARGIPTQWAKAAYAREGESLVPLPLDKIDEIRNQPPYDWSRQVIQELSIDDLDERAVRRAREKISEGYGDREGLIDGLDDLEVLDKAGITFRGQITNAAVLLLGTRESARFILGALPKITWTLYEGDGKERAHADFYPPFLLTVDEVHRKIRNEEKRIMLDPDSLIPEHVLEYDTWSLRELISNAIAHQEYDRGGKVNVEEFPGRLIFLNEGSFIPGNLETALSRGYKPPYYRNPFLVEAMLSVGMLDQNALGIRTVCEKAQERCMPLPTYHLEDPNRVRVELFGSVLDERYSQIIRMHPKLPIETVLALDKMQKGASLTDHERTILLEQGFATSGEDGILRFTSPESMRTHDADGGIEGESALSDGEECKEAVVPGGHPREKGKRYGMKRSEKHKLRYHVISLLQERGSLSRVALTKEINDRIAAEEGRGDVDGMIVYRLLKKLEDETVVMSEGETRAKVWSLKSNDG